MANILNEVKFEAKEKEIKPFLSKLDKDIKAYLNTMTRDEARQLVYAYYSMQESRIANAAKTRELKSRGSSYSFFSFLSGMNAHSEDFIKKALAYYASQNEICKWMTSFHGIGPVISTVLYSTLQVEIMDKDTNQFKRVQTAGGFWKFCGLVEGQKRVRGKPMDFSPEMKRICWLLGKSFVLVSNNPEAYYGKVYKNRKIWETLNNDNLQYKDKAELILSSRKIEDAATISCLKSGKLTKAHIDARARRYAVKLFLSHLHDAMYRYTFDEAPPLPYMIAIKQHAHYIETPNIEPITAWKPGKPKFVPTYKDQVGEDFDLSVEEEDEEED